MNAVPVSSAVGVRPRCSSVRRAGAAAVTTVLVFYIGFCLLVLALKYAVLPRLDDFKPRIEKLATQSLGQTVRIGAVETTWVGFAPRLVLRDVHLLDAAAQPALSLPLVDATWSWRTLVLGRLHFSRLVFEGPDLTVRRAVDGRLWLGGVVLPDLMAPGSAGLDWLLRQPDVQMLRGRLVWLDQLRDAPPLVLDRLSLRLRNVFNLHRLEAGGAAPGLLEAPLRILAEFRTPFFAVHPGDPRGWHGQIFAQATGFELAQWRAWTDVAPWVRQATGTARAWLRFHRSTVDDLLADVALSQVSILLDGPDDDLTLQTVSGRVGLSLRPDDKAPAPSASTDVSMRAVALTLALPGALPLAPLNGELRVTRDAHGHVTGGRLDARALALEPLLPLVLRLPLAGDIHMQLQNLQPVGYFSQLKLQWKGAADDLRQWSIDSTFQGLGWKAHEDYPGAARLSGRIAGDHRGGTFALDSPQASLDLPRVFDKSPLRFDALQTAGRWRYVDGKPGAGVQIDFDRLQAANPDVAVDGRAGYRYRDDGSSDIDLTGRILRARVDRVPDYVPTIVSLNARTWLSESLSGGTVDGGTILLRGPLQDFPFDQKRTGDFRIAVGVRDGVLDYGHGWPIIDKIRGEVVFERNSMRIRVPEAQLFGVGLQGVDVAIASLSSPTNALTVKGLAAGSLAAMLRFLKISPLSEHVGGALDEASADGMARLQLALNLPLHDAAHTVFEGRLQLAGNRFSLAPELPALQQLDGALDFSEKGLRIDRLTTSVLGGPFVLQGGGAPGDFRLRADGEVTVAGVRQFLKIPDDAALHVFSGKAVVRANLSVIEQVPALLVESNLVGLAVDLPAPLGKASADAWPLQVQSSVSIKSRNGGVERDTIRASLTKPGAAPALLTGMVERARGATGLKPVRAVLALGGSAELPAQGFVVAVTLPRIDTNSWKTALGALSSAPMRPVGGTPSAPALGLALDGVRLRTDELIVGGRHFSRFALDANRSNAALWRGKVSAKDVDGNFAWTPASNDAGAGSLDAHFARLVIPATPGDEPGPPEDDTADDGQPLRDLPALNFTIDRFALQNHELGRLKLNAINEGSGQGRQWTLRELSLSGPEFTMAAQGAWARKKGQRGRVTALDFKLDVSDAGVLFERLGQHGVFRGGKGALAGQVNWQGTPLSIDYPSLSGKLQLDSTQGQFLKADPGAARLLNVFSLQSLRKRLKLDFRDVTAEGFAYDTISANADITQGVAATRDFKMKGTTATVLIEGQTDLARETQDLRVLVLPDVNAAGGSLVYTILAANPAIGLATFAAQMLLKDPLNKALSLHYQVTGSWDEPNIKKLERKADALAPKDGG
ncbi:MAG: YhdP family protein [Burkholderiaceae bacterium]